MIANFIFNRPWNSGGRWHLVDGEFTIEVTPANENKRLMYGSTSNHTIRKEPEITTVSAKVRCGVATYLGAQGVVTTRTGTRDNFMKAYKAWDKGGRVGDVVIDVVATTQPLYVEGVETPPEPFCGNCLKTWENENV